MSNDRIKIVNESRVESLLTRGIITRRAANKSNLNKLKIIQTNISGLTLNKGSDNCVNDSYKEFNVLLVHKLFYKTVITFIMKNNPTKPIRHNPNTRYKSYNIITPKYIVIFCIRKSKYI